MTRMTFERAVLAAAAAVTLLSSAAQAETASAAPDPAGVHVTFGAADANVLPHWPFATETWSGRFTDSGFFLVNANGEDDDAHYQFLSAVNGLSSEEMRQARVQVRVAGEFASDYGSMGLLYRFDETDGGYIAFTLCAGGRYCVFQNDGGGLSVVMSGTSQAIRPDAENTLEIAPEGRGAAFYINGERVGALESSLNQGHGVGLFQAGRGAFGFDDLVIFPGASTPSAALAGGKI